MNDDHAFWIYVQQPTVPHYRLPFFDRVAEQVGNRLRVSASRKIQGNPGSVNVQREYLDLEHSCSLLFGGRAFWQSGMTPSPASRRGDVAVINGNPRFLSNLRLAYLARRRGMGIVWWGHGWSPTSRSWAAAVRASLMRHVHAVLLYTDAEADEWSRRVPQVAVMGLQNAMDQSQTLGEVARWTPERLAEFRRRQQIDNRKVLLFCGRLRIQPATGAELLLQALSRLVAMDSSYLAVIIGDGEERQRLEGLARQLGVETHVRWQGAQYDEALNAPWFLSALCFVYPGPIGLSILHAMGYGLPVITHGNRRRHNPEIAALRHEWNGLEFRDGDVEDLVLQIARVAVDSALQRRLAEKARRTAIEEFSIENMAQRFCAAVLHARRQALSSR